MNPLWKLFIKIKVLNISYEYILIRCFFPESVVKKPEEHVEIASVFLNYNLNLITIPTDV